MYKKCTVCLKTTEIILNFLILSYIHLVFVGIFFKIHADGDQGGHF